MKFTNIKIYRYEVCQHLQKVDQQRQGTRQNKFKSHELFMSSTHQHIRDKVKITGHRYLLRHNLEFTQALLSSENDRASVIFTLRCVGGAPWCRAGTAI